MQEERILLKALFWRGGPWARDPGQKCWMLADEAVFSWHFSFFASSKSIPRNLQDTLHLVLLFGSPQCQPPPPVKAKAPANSLEVQLP